MSPDVPAHRIVLTGGPGGGKTTAADLFRRELGDKVVIVPETATILFTGGFPRAKDVLATQALQRAIYHVQTELEETQALLYHDRLLVCDRGTVDGAAYWPTKPEASAKDRCESFFKTVGSSLTRELNRYSAVIFFETAAVGGLGIEGGNPARNESLKEALDIDQRLRAVWDKHPHFVLVPHQPSFVQKIITGLHAIESVLKKLETLDPRGP